MTSRTRLQTNTARGTAFEKLCALYIRVSTDMQASSPEGSLRNQEARLRAFLTSRPGSDLWKVVDVYREEGKSGKNLERPELQRLLTAVRGGQVNTVMVTKVDRITRSLLDFYHLHETFEKHGVQFISLDDNFDTTSATGRAILKTMLVFAELERERTSERTKEAMKERAKRGLWNGGHVLGYLPDPDDKGILRVDPTTKDLVQLIFTKYVELGAARKVAKHLNELGYRTPEYVSRRGNSHGGDQFQGTTIHTIASNSLYIGSIEYQGELYQGRHEAIIDRELFDKVQKLRGHNTRERRNVAEETGHDFVLEGLVRCGGCGQFMSPHHAVSKGRKYFYYRCTRDMHGGKDPCPVKSVSAKDLEKLVLERICHLSQDEMTVAAILTAHNEKRRLQADPMRSELDRARKGLKKVEEEGRGLTDSLAGGKTQEKPVFIIERLHELDAARAKLEEEVYRLEFKLKDLDAGVDNAQVVMEILQNFHKEFWKVPGHRQKEIMKLLLKAVVFTPKEVELHVYDDIEQLGFELREPTAEATRTASGEGASPREGRKPAPRVRRRTGFVQRQGWLLE